MEAETRVSEDTLLHFFFLSARTSLYLRRTSRLNFVQWHKKPDLDTDTYTHTHTRQGRCFSQVRLNQMLWPRKPSSASGPTGARSNGNNGRRGRVEARGVVRGTCAVCIRDISPAVKVNALQRREKENGRLETQAHTHNVTLESNAVKAQYAINGKSGDREGTEREKTASSSHGSVRVQKHMGMEEEGSISRPLFFLVIFFFLFHTAVSTL